MATGTLQARFESCAAAFEPLAERFTQMSMPAQELEGVATQIARDVNHTISWHWNFLFSQARREVDTALKLGTGWDSYRATPPNRAAAELAMSFIDLLSRDFFAAPHIVAASEGGIAAVFSIDDKFAQVELLNSGTVLTTTFSNQVQPKVRKFGNDLHSMSAALETIRNFLFK